MQAEIDNKWFVPQRLDAPRRVGFLTMPEIVVGFGLAGLGNFFMSLGYGLAGGFVAVLAMRAAKRHLTDTPHWRVWLYWFVSFHHKPFPESWKRVLRG